MEFSFDLTCLHAGCYRAHSVPSPNHRRVTGAAKNRSGLVLNSIQARLRCYGPVHFVRLRTQVDLVPDLIHVVGLVDVTKPCEVVYFGVISKRVRAHSGGCLASSASRRPRSAAVFPWSGPPHLRHSFALFVRGPQLKVPDVDVFYGSSCCTQMKDSCLKDHAV